MARAHVLSDADVDKARSRYGRPGLSLAILVYGFPLWWLLGLGEFAFFIAAVPMSWHLWKIRRILTFPRGFMLWLAFLAIVAASALALNAQAPYAAAGGTGSLVTYMYRFGWYLVATVVLLYIGNLPSSALRATRVTRMMAFLFVVTVAGGLLGILAPTWEARSVVEMALPGGLSSNNFLRSLVHLDAAEIQDILGYAEARPKAPFTYANSWGANLSLFLPFFLVAWLPRSAGWRRLLAIPMLVLAAVPVVASLNRALWGTLAIGVVYAGVQVVRIKGARALVPVAAVGAMLVIAVASSGLGSTIVDRFNHPHSDERRGELALQSVQSMLEGSPIIGFGNTRDVQGSFASIAGGSTPDCFACGVPPFGTQGQLWLVLFAQGLAGTAAFISFFGYRIWRHRAQRDLLTVALLAVPLFFLLEMPFYDTLGVPLVTTMIAIGLMWRAKQEEIDAVHVARAGQMTRTAGDEARTDG